MNETDRLKYDALSRQLDRVRTMQSAYFSRFFTLLLISGGAILLVALTGNPWAYMCLTFVIVTVGVMASFYLHFCDFARLHARALEGKINRLLGEKLLVAEELESAYHYPLEQPKISGLSLAAPTTFFSMFTLHFAVLWFLVIAWSWDTALNTLKGWRVTLAFLVFLVWLGANGGYLVWYFVRARDGKKIAQILRDRYGLEDPVTPPRL